MSPLVIQSVESASHKILYSKSKIRVKAAKEEIFWDPELIVVGFPSHFDGRTHPLANNCKRFARNISFETGKKVRLVDESYTSVLSKVRARMMQGRRR